MNKAVISPILLLLTIFSFLTTFAQFENTSMTRGSSYELTKTFDMDFDGDLDLIVGKSWLENNGKGQFHLRPKKIATFSKGLESISPIDFDLDGDIDIWYGTRYSFYYLENLGNDGFKQYEFNDGEVYSNLTAYDINNDSILDLIVRGDKGIIYHTYNKNSIIQKADTIFQGRFYNFRVEDINEDGYGDLFLTTSNGLYWLENLKNDSLFKISNIPVSIDPFYIRFGDYKDYNNDSIKDLLLHSVGDDEIVLIEGDTGNTFKPAKTIKKGLSSFNPRDSKIGDLDNDGYYDIYWSHSFGISWRKNIANTALATEKEFIDDGIYNLNGYNWFLFLNIDNDSLSEILTSTEKGIVIFNEDSTNTGYNIDRISGSLSKKVTTIISDDLNNDGKNDVVVGSLLRGNIAYFQQNDSSEFASYSILDIQPCESLTAYDVDGDGLKDLSGGSFSSYKAFWLKNLGDGKFSTIKDIGIDKQIKAIEYFKIDSDSLEDLFYYTENYGYLGWRKNLGGGSFSSNTTIIDQRSGGQNTMYVKILDYDKDGIKDIVALWGGSNREICWYKNFGNGTIGPSKTIFKTDTTISTMDVGDIDNDGDFDFLLSRYYNAEQNVEFLTNEGNGKFKIIKLDSNIRHSTSAKCFIKDMNNDSIPDLIVPSYTSLNFYIQFKKGEFSKHVYNDEKDEYLLFDIDKDGFTDIVTHEKASLLLHHNLDLRFIKTSLGKDTTLCYGDSISFNVEAASLSKFKYKWHHNADTIPFKNDSSISILMNDTTEGLYYCEINNGIRRVFSDSSFVNVISKNRGNYVVDGDSITTTNQSFIYIINDSIKDNQYNFYSELSSNFSISNDSITIYWDTTGTDTLNFLITDKLGCFTDTVHKIVKINTVVSSKLLNDCGDVLTYPNPSNGAYTIDLSNSKCNTPEIQVRDSYGRLVNYSIQRNTNEFIITNLKPGVYYIDIINLKTNDYRTEKIIVI